MKFGLRDEYGKVRCILSKYTMHSYTVYIYRVGRNHTFMGINGVHTLFLAGKSPYIRHFYQGNYHTYVHIRCRYTVLADPARTYPYTCLHKCTNTHIYAYTYTHVQLLKKRVQTLPSGI